MTDNLEVVLAGPVLSQPCADDFTLVESKAPEPQAGEMLVRNRYLSLDPYLGSRLRGRHMGQPAPRPGERLPGFCVGEVTVSRHPDFAVGETVVGEIGWALFGRLRGDAARKVDPAVALSAHLGVLGMPGLTAWAGVTQLAKVKEGDVFVVDAASGAVGGTAGQIARRLGARVVGIAGGPAKCALVREVYGFDDCVDYRTDDWIGALKAACGSPPSVHFENVGLKVLGPVLDMLGDYGRVVLCGLADHYQSDAPPAALPLGRVVARRAQILGLVVYDFLPRFAEWTTLAAPWIAEGGLAYAEDVCDGLASAPRQFEKLMRGENLGKTLVRIVPP